MNFEQPPAKHKKAPAVAGAFFIAITYAVMVQPA